MATGGAQREASRACVAANPTKYGQACVLSSCEAIAAALYIAGFPHDARLVMEKFKWGDSFFQLRRLLKIRNVPVHAPVRGRVLVQY